MMGPNFNAVSASHCQEFQNEKIYSLQEIKYEKTKSHEGHETKKRKLSATGDNDTERTQKMRGGNKTPRKNKGKMRRALRQTHANKQKRKLHT